MVWSRIKALERDAVAPREAPRHHSQRRLVAIHQDEATAEGQRALHPSKPAAEDAFGAKPGPLVVHDQQLITVIHDRLGIFKTTSGAFPGFSTYQPVRSVAPPGKVMSSAGVTNNALAVVGYDLGQGTVVDVGLLNFGSRLAHNIDAQELVDGVWKLLSS